MENQENIIDSKIRAATEAKSSLLNLAGLKIEEVPISISGVKNLQVLNLRDNKIKILRPLPYLPNLKVIYLDSNYVEEIDPTFFDSVNLTVLNLTNNCLQKIPSNIDRQVKLKRLFLSSNLFADFPEGISKLRSLEILEIANNDIKNIPKSINELSNLNSFSAYENQIKEIGFDFQRLVKLEHLNLARNHIKSIPESFQFATAIKSFSIYSNQLSNFPNLENPNLKLVDLNLADNNIKNIPNINGALVHLHFYFNPTEGNQLDQLKNTKINNIYIDLSQADHFIVENKTMEAVKIINNKRMEIINAASKTVPPFIEKKFGLKSRYQMFKERIKNQKLQ